MIFFSVYYFLSLCKVSVAFNISFSHSNNNLPIRHFLHGHWNGDWRTIFKYCSFISFPSFSCIIICSCSWNYYSSTYMYVCMTMNTQTWHYYYSFKFNLAIIVMYSTWVIIFSYPNLVRNLDGWFGVLSNKFTVFWYSIIIVLY